MASNYKWVFRFTSNVPEVKSNTDMAMRTAAEIIGGKAETYAKYMAPIKTGNLKNSITHVTEMEDGKYTVVIGSNVEYAPYQELGAPNAHVPAHPYLRPALENHLSEYQSVVSGELSKV